MRQGCSVIVVLLVYWLVPGHCLTFAVTKNVKFCYFADMHQLSAEQQETLSKNSTDRLRVMAVRTGNVTDDELETMDRTALLELMARSMVVKMGAILGATGGGAVSDTEQTDRAREVELQLALNRMELESERERERVRMEAEIEKEKDRAEAGRVKAASDAESEKARDGTGG